MATLMLIVHLGLVAGIGNFWATVEIWLDNGAYIEIAKTIRQWSFDGVEKPQHFWGFPWMIAGVSWLFSVSDSTALVAISVMASLITCALLWTLYGGWIASAVPVLNHQWTQLSIEGGSEPLFMCFLYGMLLAMRRDAWPLAAVLASLATTVRPIGIVLLVSLAAILAWRRRFGRLAAVIAIGLAVGVVYVIPVWLIFGSPSANLELYRPFWGASGWAVTYPFEALLRGYRGLLSWPRWTMMAFAVGWPVMATLASVIIWRKHGDRLEAVVLGSYVLFLVCLNHVEVLGAFARFLLPVLPLIVLAFHEWVPKDRRIIWAAGGVSTLLATAGVVGFKSLFGFRLP